MEKKCWLMRSTLCVMACAATAYAGHVMHLKYNATSNAAQATDQEVSASEKIEETSRKIPFQPSDLRSTDTVESLQTLGADEIYSRLALWLADASSEDIERFFSAYRNGKIQSNELTSLIFLQWTYVNPQSARAIAKGSEFESFFWFAWTQHEPQKALHQAIADAPQYLSSVGKALGEFHSEWLLKNFESLPQACREAALLSYNSDESNKDVGLELAFLHQNHISVSEPQLENFIRQDPMAVYEWFVKNPTSSTSTKTKDILGLALKEMGIQSPKMLEQLARVTPKGSQLRKINMARFNLLLKNDPDEALSQAKQEISPQIAAENWAALANHYAKDQPDKATEMALEMIRKNPDAIYTQKYIIEDKVPFVKRNQQEEAHSAIRAALEHDALGFIEQLSAISNANVYSIASEWGNLDFPSMEKWIREHELGEQKQPWHSALANQYTQQEKYMEGLEWAVQESPQNASYMYRRWHGTQPEEAVKWLENARLPESLRKSLTP